MSLNRKYISCRQDRVFLKIHFANLCLLIKVLSLFKYSVISDKVGFMSAILLFFFYMDVSFSFISHYCLFYVIWMLSGVSFYYPLFLLLLHLELFFKEFPGNYN